MPVEKKIDFKEERSVIVHGSRGLSSQLVESIWAGGKAECHGRNPGSSCSNPVGQDAKRGRKQFDHLLPFTVFH